MSLKSDLVVEILPVSSGATEPEPANLAAPNQGNRRRTASPKPPTAPKLPATGPAAQPPAAADMGVFPGIPSCLTAPRFPCPQ